MTSSSGRLFFVTPVEKAQFVPRALHSGDFLPPFFESSGEKRFAYSRPQIRKRGQKNPRLCPRYEITIFYRSDKKALYSWQALPHKPALYSPRDVMGFAHDVMDFAVTLWILP